MNLASLTKRASRLHSARLVSLPEEPLLYLIGGNHAVQFKSALSQAFGESERVHKKREACKAHVAEMIDKLGIEILAEEFSEEAKGQPDAWEAVREKVAAELGTTPEPLNWETVLEQFKKAKAIEHRFCDPDSEERKALGIEVDPHKETESDRDKRERVWLCRIGDCKHKRVLFVCGDDHYESFAQKLTAAGFKLQRGPHYDISDEEFYNSQRTSPDV